MWLSHLLIAAAIVSQSGAGAAPATTVTRHRTFAIPYRLNQVDEAAKQPVEVQLYVSSDRGANWRFYAKAPTTQEHFMFRAGGDGEYWFAIRTIDRSGRVRPKSISAPGLRVVVDTSAPPRTPPDSRRSAPAKTPAYDAARPPKPVPKGSVAIAINPPIGSKRNTAVEPSSAVPRPSKGERPRMVNYRLFELEYDIESVGPSGIGRVELWGTRDGGRTWRSFALDNDSRSPLLVSVAGEGIYGFRVTVTNGVGLGGDPPVPGDPPDVVIGVDLSKPTARIISARQGVEDETGKLIISWQADDRMLADRPVSLFFSESRAGPWQPVAESLENTGRHAWPIDERTPARFYLRLEVRDAAGNVGVHELNEPVEIDRSRPTVRIRGVRPAGRNGERP